MVILENFWIWFEYDTGSIAYGRFLNVMIFQYFTSSILNFLHFPISYGLHQKNFRKCIYCFCTNSVQTNRFLKSSRIIFSTRVNLGYAINDFSKRYSSAIISYCYLMIRYTNFNGFSMPHDKFIYAIINNFF